MALDPSNPQPPPDAETTITRRTWEEPSANGGPPTSIEEIVTTTSWTTSTTFTTEDGQEIPADEIPASWREEIAAALATSDTPRARSAAPAAAALPPSALTSLSKGDQDGPDLPGVPRARRSGPAAWLERLRGR